LCSLALQVLPYKVTERAGELDACGPPSDHHEAQQLAHILLRGPRQRGQFEELQDAGPQLDRVQDLQEEEEEEEED
jgi:hypothetical protein